MNEPSAAVLTYYFDNGTDAISACQSFYDDNAWCVALTQGGQNKTLSTTAPIVGDTEGALFIWDTQNCAQIADSQTVTDGLATYVGECMSATADALAFSVVEVGELTGYMLLSWALGYTSGALMKWIQRSIEVI